MAETQEEGRGGVRKEGREVGAARSGPETGQQREPGQGRLGRESEELPRARVREVRLVKAGGGAVGARAGRMA